MDMRRTTVITVVLVAAALRAAGSAQQPSPPPEQTARVLRGGVTAVLVDVVVRDRHNLPVRDLTRSDFEVLEDGVPQTVDSFTVMSDKGAATAAAPAAPAPASATTPVVGTVAGSRPSPPALGPSVTALVFHGLPLESLRPAIQAAQKYVGSKEETDNYIGVFDIDLSLQPLVPFTRNGLAVRHALDVMATGATSSGIDRSSVLLSSPPGVAATITPSPGGPPVIGSLIEEMVNGFAALERDRAGYIFTDALSAMIRTLGRLPGRKSIVLFSQGIGISSAVHPLYLGVMDAANRANVTIYTIDAAGLRVASPQLTARDGIYNLGLAGVATNYAAETVTAGPLTAGLEYNEYLLRSDPHWNLGTLAQETGGLLFNGANDLRPAFERIDSDQRNYYLLGYNPVNRALDGKFRAITVKVKRPGVTVAARKGYFAVRNPANLPINAWEAPALGALEQKPVPNAFPFLAAALQFPERGRPGLLPVVAQVPTAPLTFQPAADGKTYTSDFILLVRFLDAEKQVVRKVSQHYEIRGPVADIAKARQGQVLFYRESELPPGVYTMETVVHDALSGKASTRFSTLEVPRYEEGRMRMSSVMLVGRGEQVSSGDQPPDNPLLVNGVALQPNLGGVVRKAAQDATFYFTVYPAAGHPPEVFIQLTRNGIVLVQMPMSVPQPDASGRIQQLGRLPLASIAPGSYGLRVIVKQGLEQAVRTTMLTVTE